MKGKIFAVFSIFTALLLASCSGVNTLETDLEPTVELNEENDNSKQTYITLSVKRKSNRTALPVINNVESFTSFTLQVKRNGETLVSKNWNKNGNLSAYTQMTNDSIAISSGNTYDFILTAKLYGATFQGQLNQYIEQGENTLNFSLVLLELSDNVPALDMPGNRINSHGSLMISIALPSSVKAADVEVTTLNGTVITSPFASTAFIDKDDPANSSYNLTSNIVIYSNLHMDAGNYIATFTFYGNTAKTLKLGQWCEYAGIAYGLESESEIIIESEDELESIYSITINPDNGTLSTPMPGSYTRFSSEIVLPTASQISRPGYRFEGWYDAETGGNRVETIPAGSVGNKTLYARWSIVDYTITVDYNTSWGTVTIPATAHYNDEVTLSFEPKTGCQFNSISSEDVTFTGSGTSRSFTMPASNITITANFAKTHLGTKDNPDAVWDIVFNDGTATPYSDSLTLTQAQKEAAVAILYYHENDDDYIYGIALKHTNTYFCSSTASFYDRHDDLSSHDGPYNNYMIYHNAEDYSESNYPSVWWAKHYQGTGNLGNVARDINGGYNYNWYVPCIQELRTIYDQKTTLSAIINLIGSPYADPLTPENNTLYGTTTQSDENDNSAVYKDLNNGSETHGAKNMQTNTLLIRKFTPANGVSE